MGYKMSLVYCRECDKNIDTDFDEHYEHFSQKVNWYSNKVELKGGNENDRKDN